MISDLVLAACGGFLLAVLWMDLMFDVQVLPYRKQAGELPEPVLGSIAAYYRRVTTTASPMNALVATVMLIAVATLLVKAFASAASGWVMLASFGLAGGPIALAAARVVPNAVRLGSRVDPAATQSDLARAICRDHLLCLACIIAFVALQMYAVVR